MIHARKDYNRRIQDNEKLIPESEPVFLIRAQSPAAGDTLRYFAASIEDMGADRMVVHAIREHADKMDAWDKKKEIGRAHV